VTTKLLPRVAKDEQKIRELIEAAVFALHTGTIDDYFRFYADDAVWMIPSSYHDVGLEEARTFYGFTAKFRFDQRLTINEVFASGDRGHARISLEGYLRPRAEANVAPLRSISRHLWILERRGKRGWLIVRCIRPSISRRYG